MDLIKHIIAVFIAFLFNPLFMFYGFFWVFYSGILGGLENWYFIPNVILFSAGCWFAGMISIVAAEYLLEAL